eukprot:m.106558 g.106558  ORF g.106558 m.106558 type:complete len:52 (-) comp16906_c0_seq6:99-254(-)
MGDFSSASEVSHDSHQTDSPNGHKHVRFRLALQQRQRGHCRRTEEWMTCNC